MLINHSMQKHRRNVRILYLLATVFKLEHRPTDAVTNTQKVVQRSPKKFSNFMYIKREKYQVC